MRIDSTELVEFLGAHDVANALAISAPTSATARVYDERADMRLTAAVASATVAVDRVPASIAVGDAHEFRLDDDTREVETVASFDPEAKTITYNAQPTGAASTGNRIARKLGADITLSLFGTPTNDPLDETWGFRGAVTPFESDGYQGGMRVRIEVAIFDASSQRLDKLYCTIEAAEETTG